MPGATSSDALVTSSDAVLKNVCFPWERCSKLVDLGSQMFKAALCLYCRHLDPWDTWIRKLELIQKQKLWLCLLMRVSSNPGSERTHAVEAEAIVVSAYNCFLW